MGGIKENTTGSSKIKVEHKKSEYTVVHVFPANTEDGDERLKKFKRQVIDLILASAPHVQGVSNYAGCCFISRIDFETGEE